MRTTLAVSTASFALILILFGAPSTSRADNLFVSNTDNDTIEEFNSSGVGTTFASSGLNNAKAICFDNSGNLYASNFGDGTIERFNTNGVGTTFASGLSSPWGVVVDKAGNLYVANQGNNTIEKFNTNGVGTTFASGLETPVGLAFENIPEPSTWAMVALGMGAVLGGWRLRRRSS